MDEDEPSLLAKEISGKKFDPQCQPNDQLDYSLPSNDFRTSEPEGAINIICETNEDELLQPESIISFFRRTVDKYPHNIALTVKRNDVETTWSYLEYWNEVRTVAKAFIKLGLLPFHGSCILGYNSPEWMISYLGTIFAGGFCAGIYTTNSPEASYHVLSDCLANVAVVENEFQLSNILRFKDKLPSLRAIVQYNGKSLHSNVLSWRDLLYIGKSVSDEVLEMRIKAIALNQCCSLIYTSGTTGNAKGVMLSHDNIVTATKLLCKDYLRHKNGSERFISYLPLSHVAALSHEIYVPIYVAANVNFAPPDALKGKLLLDALQDVNPTSFVGVPRVYEKIYEKMQEIEARINLPKKYLLKWSQRQALKFHTSHDKKVWNSWMFSTAKKLMLNKIKSTVGLQFAEFLLCGSAPLSDEVLKYFFGLDLPIVEGYAQSEASGLHVVSKITECRIGSVGKPDEFKNFEVKIASPDKDGTGEILLRGRNICMGYIHLKEKTEEAIDNERWLRTGDIGKIDEDGYLYITGRIKELIITSGGENIPPIIIEQVIKKLVPAISNCMIIGDRRKYLTMLITFLTEVDPATLQPLDRLSQSAVAWCRSCGSSVSTVSEILREKDELLMNAIQQAVDTYNNIHAISRAQRIQKWRILDQDFSIQGGELGPTAKLKRSYVVEKYSEIVEQMYSEG